MTRDDSDLAAVRTTLSVRTADTDTSVARAWTAVADRRATHRPAGVPARVRPARRLVPAGAAVAVAALAVGTVALLGSGDDVLAPADLSRYPRITDPAEIVFPLDEYSYTSEGYQKFQQARAMLVADCLRRFGVDVASSPGPAVVPYFQVGMNQRRYGPFDLDIAREEGYRVPPYRGTVRLEGGWWSGAPRGWDPNDEEHFLYLGRYAAEFADHALPRDVNGDPLREDGCGGEASWILSDGQSGLEGPNWKALNSDAGPRAATDARVLAAEAAWSECMRRDGFDYRSVWEPLEREWPTPPSREEIATAVADVSCKIETNLIGVWVAVESEYQEQHIQQRWDELQELKRWLDAVYRNSARVLAEAEAED
jgi:hypothetical protein